MRPQLWAIQKQLGEKQAQPAAALQQLVQREIRAVELLQQIVREQPNASAAEDKYRNDCNALNKTIDLPQSPWKRDKAPTAHQEWPKIRISGDHRAPGCQQGTAAPGQRSGSCF
ncbi:uncharacterized protein TM35_000931040 [Trypanosoma theileri]|uniref:Uncharacterized protein n=1 Tax=Trypanosoma theileri TaxID=67003 RepID=A0A1X0NEF8_9TRYP|nr:uncharacterized protein TM35_000931040 [Trypanosoma theileri]ORC82346.1 hypothetical protein TM35_000931040 [Trypanosoma theileri]